MGRLTEPAAIEAVTSALFLANTLLLLVMAGAFFPAWRRQRRERAWISWMAANLVMAAAFVLFMVVPPSMRWLMVAPNVLHIFALSLRWRAARQFNRRPSPWVVCLAPAAIVMACYALRGLFSYAALFVFVNAWSFAVATIVGWEFWRDRHDGLRSRYGLVFAYGTLSLSYFLRTAQGFTLDPGVQNLPMDALLAFNLLLAIIHTAASGAFALSLAFERGANGLREVALRDPLTGLHNRRAFEARMAEQLAVTPRRDFALVLLDVDHFKAVNDRYGHAAGDDALKVCAEICRRELEDGDFVARIGGEEFALVLPDISAEDALRRTESVRLAVEACEIASGRHRFHVTVSAGLFHGRAGAAELDRLMRDADRSLYRAKETGRNRTQPSAA